jgi:hypothetical protein
MSLQTDGYFFVLFTISQCFMLGSLVVRPSSYRWLFFPLIASLDLVCYFLSCTNGDYTIVLLRAATLGRILTASDYILLTDVQRELRVVGQRESISNADLMSRFKWALQLSISTRAVGWTHEPISVLPPHPNLTRVQFVKSRLGWLAMYLLMNDVSSVLIRANPFFARDGLTFTEQPLRWRSVNIVLFAMVQAMHLNIPYTLCSIFAVGSGLSPPDMWPHLMGKLGDTYTVRRFWG